MPGDRLRWRWTATSPDVIIRGETGPGTDMDDRVDFLAKTELLSAVPRHLVTEIDRRLKEVAIAAGETLFEEGDVGDAVYIVVSGGLRLEVGDVTLLRRGPGDCVGEIALIDEGPRSAAAVAESDTRLLRWERHDFHKTLSKDPEVARGIFNMLTTKLREDVRGTVRLEREKERWRQDLLRAREIQQGMLPAGRLELDVLELAGVCSSASEVGGDFYDYLCADNGDVALIIGDVTGHGFYAGLFVAMAKSCLHTQARFSLDPREVMDAMRRTMDLSIQRRLLMSCCYVLFEPAAGRLHYANAGHPYPYVYRAAGGGVERLDALDPILGALDAGTGGYAERSIAWEPGDALVAYTDGITEARDAEGRMFDHHRLEECLVAHGEGSAEALLQGILGAVSRHAGERTPTDDLTLVVVKARAGGAGP